MSGPSRTEFVENIITQTLSYYNGAWFTSADLWDEIREHGYASFSTVQAVLKKMREEESVDFLWDKDDRYLYRMLLMDKPARPYAPERRRLDIDRHSYNRQTEGE